MDEIVVVVTGSSCGRPSRLRSQLCTGHL